MAIDRTPPASAPSAPHEISDEPLINAIHRKMVGIVFAAYAAVLVYTSFVPFDLSGNTGTRSGPGFFLGLPVVPFSLPDILSNIALYVPLGALGFAVWRRRGLGRIASCILAVLSASLLSVLVEHGQYWVQSRVSTWVDVTANALGGSLGVVLVATWESQIRRLLMRARRAAQRNWCLTLAKAAVCAVLLVHLRPYDVVVDVYHTAAGLRHVEISPLAGWHGLRAKVAGEVFEGRRRGMHELPRERWEYILDRIGDVAAYAGVVALLAVALASQFSSRGLLYLWVGFVGASLAAMVTLIRIFLISHGLDTAYFCSAVLGWPLGCAVAHRVLAGGGSRASRLRRGITGETPVPPGSAGETSVPRESTGETPVPPDHGRDARATRSAARWPRAAIGLALLLVVAYELVPFDFGTRAGADVSLAARQVCLLPFEAHFNSRPNEAFYDISGEFLRYVLIGVCLSMIVRRRRSGTPWRRQLRTVVAATGVAAVVLECLHLVMATRQTDVTTILIALGGGFVGAVAVRWATDYRASWSVLVVDDLLTRELIGGASAAGGQRSGVPPDPALEASEKPRGQQTTIKG